MCDLEAKLASLLDAAEVREDLEKREVSLARRLGHQKTVGATLWEMISGMMSELKGATDSVTMTTSWRSCVSAWIRSTPQRLNDCSMPMQDATILARRRILSKLLERYLTKGNMKVDAVVDTSNHGPCEPLICAAGACSLDVVRLLIRFGADVSKTGGHHDNAALVTGNQCDSSDITDALLQAGWHRPRRAEQ